MLAVLLSLCVDHAQAADTTSEQAKSFFTLVVVVSLAGVWFLYLVFGNARFLGFLLTKILQWRLRTRENLYFIKIGSVSVSLFAGMISFRDFRYVDKNRGITVVDGFIQVRYWLSNVRETIGDVKGERLHLQLNGFALHVFNSTSTYDMLKKLLSDATLANVENAHHFGFHPVPTVGAPPPAASPDTAVMTPGLRLFKRLFPVTQLSLGKGRVIFGNRDVPSMLVAHVRTCELGIRIMEQADKPEEVKEDKKQGGDSGSVGTMSSAEQEETPRLSKLDVYRMIVAGSLYKLKVQ